MVHIEKYQQCIPGDGGYVPRRSSEGNKTQMKSSGVPPPIKPKPEKEMISGATPFPIMSHDANVSASPLQKAHLQQQVGQVKKPLIAAKKTSVLRSSGKGKKPDKPPLPSKPSAPPRGSAPTIQLQAELAAKLRKQDS